MNRWISKTPKCEIVTATRAIVDELLAANTENRKVRPLHKRYLRDLVEAGHFTVTNQGIGVDVDGVMIDGQHRLEAIAAAGYPPVQFTLVYGLPRAARAAVDQGFNRTLSDVLHFAFDHPSATSTMVSMARIWGRMTQKKQMYGKVSPQEVEGWYVRLLPAMERMFAIPGATKLPAPVLAAIGNRLVEVPHDHRPLEFLEKVLTGANLEADSPALKLRNYIAGATFRSVGGSAQVERFNKTATALDAYLENRPVMRLHARPLARIAVAA
jgi:hypothetical protein